MTHHVLTLALRPLEAPMRKVVLQAFLTAAVSAIAQRAIAEFAEHLKQRPKEKAEATGDHALTKSE